MDRRARDGRRRRDHRAGDRLRRGDLAVGSPLAGRGAAQRPGRSDLESAAAPRCQADHGLRRDALYRRRRGARVTVFKSTATTHVVAGLKNGKAYSFRIAARTAAGTGPRSAPTAVITVGSPVAPSGVSAVPGDAQAKVSWKSPAQNNGAAITSYVVIGYVKWYPAKQAHGPDRDEVGHRDRARQRRDLPLQGRRQERLRRRAAVAAIERRGTGERDERSARGRRLLHDAPGRSDLAFGATRARRGCAGHRGSRGPGNNVANHTVPHLPITMGTNFDYTSKWKADYFPRITGNFTGTTDEIIQWAACKWGMVRQRRARPGRDRGVRLATRRTRVTSRTASDGHCAYDDHARPVPDVIRDHPGEVVLPPRGQLVVVAAVELSVDQARAPRSTSTSSWRRCAAATTA